MSKILITVTGSWGTGSFSHAKAVIEKFTSLGHTVKLFFPDNKGSSEDAFKYFQNEDLYEVWEFPIQNEKTEIENFPLMIPDPHPRNPNGKTYLKLSKDQKDLFYSELEGKLKKLLATFKPDVILSHHIWSMAYVIHKLGYEYFLIAHFSDQMGFEYDKSIREIATIAAKNAKKIIASSKFIKDKVKKLYDVDDDHVQVIFPGYADKIFYKKDVDKKKLFKKLNLNISLDSKIINFVGSNSKTKGFDILLQANKMIDKNENIHFFVFGGGDVKDVMDKDLLDKYSLENIHFFGYQTQDVIADAHNIAQAGILPSRQEGFGIACLEAMGCSLPVIVSDSGGQKEFVVGKIIEAKNPQKLKDAILAIINMNPNSYSELSQMALNQAKKYTWDKMIEKRIEVYFKNTHS